MSELSEAQREAFREAWRTVRIRRKLYDVISDDRKRDAEGHLSESRGEVLARWYRHYKRMLDERPF